MAFLKVFRSKQTRYREVILWLEQKAQLIKVGAKNGHIQP
jgi:hypothetical protein